MGGTREEFASGTAFSLVYSELKVEVCVCKSEFKLWELSSVLSAGRCFYSGKDALG